jgi:ribosomal protein S18 acetylase RimI-like enzyme
MKIIPYEEKYRQDVRQICLETGSADNFVNQQHHDFTLLMYCDPYLDHGRCFLLLDDEGKVQGYILSAIDNRTFIKKMQPYFDEIKRVAPDFVSRCDMSEYEKYMDAYPAHLHIDILESYTGHGRGTALMQTLLDSLRKDHIKGIMVGVAADNSRARSFYEKMGFKVIESDQYGAVLAQKLA